MPEGVTVTYDVNAAALGMVMLPPLPFEKRVFAPSAVVIAERAKSKSLVFANAIPVNATSLVHVYCFWFFTYDAIIFSVAVFEEPADVGAKVTVAFVGLDVASNAAANWLALSPVI